MKRLIVIIVGTVFVFGQVQAASLFGGLTKGIQAVTGQKKEPASDVPVAAEDTTAEAVEAMDH